MIIFDIQPVPKPRMVDSDKWKNRPEVLRYWAFKEELQLKANLKGFNLGEAFIAIFYLPMPKSWDEKRKREMILVPHQQKPDTDNLMKALKDSLLPNDSTVWFELGVKLWSNEGHIDIANLSEEEARKILHGRI